MVDNDDDDTHFHLAHERSYDRPIDRQIISLLKLASERHDEMMVNDGFN